MAEVYYYIPISEAEYVVGCGLKLSKWYDKEVLIDGDKKKCISALLNPKDDIEKYNDNNLVCIKLEIPSNYCYIADKYLYNIGIDTPKVMKFYINSIIPIEKYIFGFHRLPECLVTTTAIEGQISIMNKVQDSPVLINSSEELYIYNLIEMNKERYLDFEDTSLYYFYSNLAEFEKIDKIEDKKKKIAIFIDKEVKRAIVIKVPEAMTEIEEKW
jgi:hypothetical protein